MTQRGIVDLKAFVPAKDLERSRRFYLDLGFHENWGNDEVRELEVGGFRFLLQKFYVADHANNFMMSLTVEDADSWWEHISDAGLVGKYGLAVAKPPELQPWGLRVLYLSIPPACCGTSPSGRSRERVRPPPNLALQRTPHRRGAFRGIIAYSAVRVR